MDPDYNADLDNADIAQAGHEAHDQPLEQPPTSGPPKMMIFVKASRVCPT
jgi:hypothetical protein